MKKTFLKFAVATLCCSMIATSFTACTDDTTEDDSAEIAEKFNFDYLTALANNDGTITISGTVTTNKKLKKFTLTSTTRFDENNKAIEYDLLDGSEAEKERTEDGKTWTATLSSTNIPVDIYKLEVRTRMAGTKTATIGENYTFEAGTSKNAELGSYLSFSKKANFSLSALLTEDKKESSDALKYVEAILKDDKCADVNNPKVDELYIETIQKAKNNVIKTNATNKAHVYDDCIITSTDCIATYSIEQLDETDPTHVTISGIVLTSEEGTLMKIDVSGEDWD